MKSSLILTRAVTTILIALALFVSGMPLYWIVITSFKPRMEWTSIPPTWWPSTIDLNNYALMWWEKGGQYAFLNTLIIGLSSALISVLVGSLCGYAISRYRTGGNSLLFSIISVKMLPPATIFLPVLLMYTTYGLIDTYQGLVLMYTLMNLPYSVYLMKTLFDGVPYTIEEAAMIDGCSPLGVFRMAMRLAAAGLVVTFLFGLIFSWNEFFFALTLTRIHASTVPVKLASWYTPNTGNWWGPQAAQCLVASIPILVLFAFLQKWIVKGLTFGAVKG